MTKIDGWPAVWGLLIERGISEGSDLQLFWHETDAVDAARRNPVRLCDTLGATRGEHSRSRLTASANGARRPGRARCSGGAGRSPRR